MTLREEIINYSRDNLNESILPPEFYANMTTEGFMGVIGLQALTVASLTGLVALLAKLNDKAQNAIVRRHARKALEALDIKEEDKKAIEEITKEWYISIKERKAMIERVLMKYRK